MKISCMLDKKKKLQHMNEYEERDVTLKRETNVLRGERQQYDYICEGHLLALFY